MRRPKKLLIYHGILSKFNQYDNPYDYEKIAKDLAGYNVIVLGDGLQELDNEDFDKSKEILDRVRYFRPNIEIYGHVDTDLEDGIWLEKVNNWYNNLDVNGIFMNNSGYDYGTWATNGRRAFIWKVDYIHSKAMKCFVNASNPDHVLGVNNDRNYPNTTWNPNQLGTNLSFFDIYLLEHFVHGKYDDSNELKYEYPGTWELRGKNANKYREKIRLASASQLDHSSIDPQYPTIVDIMIQASALMHNLDYVSMSDVNYSKNSNFCLNISFNRDIDRDWGLPCEITHSGLDYYRFYEHGCIFMRWVPGQEGANFNSY